MVLLRRALPTLSVLSRPLAAPRAASGLRMVHTEKKIAELGLTLPSLPAPLASYALSMKSGNHVFLSGHVPFKENMKDLYVGKVGKDYTTEEGAQIARTIGLELVSTLQKACGGDLDKVKRIVKLVGFVNCAPPPALPPRPLRPTIYAQPPRAGAARFATPVPVARRGGRAIRSGSAQPRPCRPRPLRRRRLHPAARGDQRVLRPARRDLRRARHARALRRRHQLPAAPGACRDRADRRGRKLSLRIGRDGETRPRRNRVWTAGVQPANSRQSGLGWG